MATVLRAVIEATGLSRRNAFAAIREGRVTLDGVDVRDPSAALGAGALALDGRFVEQTGQGKAYLLLNKPPGYLTTVSDERGRATVIDLVPAALRVPGLHPVGRLDKDTTGLLLLTNDGGLTHRLTHPRYEVEKEYWAGLGRPLTEPQLAALRRGVTLDGRLRRPRGLRLLAGEAPFAVSVTIGEGRKRQVRRLFEAVGARVRRLKRVREGALLLAGLEEGALRPLTAAEIDALRREGTGSSAQASVAGVGRPDADGADGSGNVRQ